MRVFAVPQVSRFLRKERIPDAVLCPVAREVVQGRLAAGEADLGGGLYKKRLARPGSGKSGGYRVLIGYRAPRSDRVLFTFAFAKNTAATLTPAGHAALSKVAWGFIAATEVQVAALIEAGEVREIGCDGEAE